MLREDCQDGVDVEITPTTVPLFEDLCKKRLNKAISLVEERGQQYGDTLRNNQWLCLKSVLQIVYEGHYKEVTPNELRAIGIASLVDIKYQRLEGGYKEDHLDDGINYQAVLAELVASMQSRV